MTTVLEKIIVRFPNTNPGFTNSLALLLNELGENKNHVFELHNSNLAFYPVVCLDFQAETSLCLTDFVLSTGERITTRIENLTRTSRQSPHTYHHIGIDAAIQRFTAANISVTGIDHVGFNLPWFLPGLHPGIAQLRQQLYSRCLYHRFPTGEFWDFIIPGDEAEIDYQRDVNYAQIRRPKFEIVSFEKASTPLIQFDISVNSGYEDFSLLFPEALNDGGLRNIWIYLETPYGVDVCLVVNETADHDWSNFFEGFRLATI